MRTPIGDLIVRYRKTVLIGALLFTCAAGAFGSGAVELFKGGGLIDPASESAIAADVLSADFGAGTPNLVLLAESTDQAAGVDDPAVQAAGIDLTQRLSQEADVSRVVSYWTTGAPGLRSTDGRTAMILAEIDGDENAALSRLKELRTHYVDPPGTLTVRATGALELERQLEETISADLIRAESVAVPITLILLVVIFGTLTAAMLPLIVGGLSILGTLAILRTLEIFTDVSVFALNLTTALALGLGIDYGLLMVSRFREELAAGLDPHAAAAKCVRTAGRTIIFSATTVAAALSALLAFPQFFFRSFAYAGVAVCLLAAVGAAVVLPALLATLGHRVEFLTVRRRTVPGRHAKGYFYQLAESVMRRPVVIAACVTLMLLIIGIPFLSAKFSLPDDRVLPAEASSRQVSDVIRNQFNSSETGATYVVAEHSDATPDQLTAYAMTLSQLDNVSRVDASTGSYADGSAIAPATPASAALTSATGTYLTVVPNVEPTSTAAETLVEAVRATPAPFEFQLTGASATLVDAKQSMAEHLPLALLIIGITTFILLFLMMGSVVLPLKAIVLNLLSLTALYGSMVWIFQDGHFSDLLGFTATGTLNLAMPVLMFCIAFGLSMDYEVFLMSRIKEEHARGSSNVTAVAQGLQRTGGIVTAAAVLMSVVFLSFATSGVSLIKLFGLGVTVAVLMDSLVIRPLLVPSFISMAGPLNWWAPRPLRVFHNRFGWVENTDHPVPAANRAPAHATPTPPSTKRPLHAAVESA
jgi:RND superfamily putative drug exporter